MGEDPAPVDDLERFEKAVRLFAEVQLSAERTVNQLLRAGFSRELVRSRFGSLPESAFDVAVDARDQARWARLSARPNAANESNKPLVSATTIARHVLERSARASIQPQPPTASMPQTTEAKAGRGALAAGVSFQYVPLIQCSFPHADPGERTRFTRRNGWLELTLSSSRPDVGLPYGVPARLLTIYCATEALRTRSPEIFLGNSVQEFLRRLDVPITRGERGSLRVYANQLLRLIHCAVSIDENVRDASGRTGLHIRQALFVEEARLWWDEASGLGQGSSLVLSSVLFDSMLERSAPLSTQAIRQLRKSPMDLDVYAWLAHRLFQLHKPSTISWPQLSAQFGHDYGELRYFRRFFGDSLKRVLKVYPEAKLKCTDAGVVLQPSRPSVPRPEFAAR